MLIITGMGRSGTSVMSMFCKRMGYDVGGHWNESVNAGLECRRLMQINNRIIDGDHNNQSQTYEAIKNFPSRPVVKDPRFSFPEVMHRWVAARDDLRFLMLLRETEVAVKSR